jgi:hypothetical protein
MEVREATIGKFRGHDVVTLGAEATFIAEEGKPPTRARIVIVRPGESANRRVYPSDTIAEAVRTGFWNDSKMFIDHGDIKMPTHRSIKDLVGVIESTDVGPAGEAVGEVRFVRPEFAQFAMEAKDAIGVSIVHQFQGQRFKGTDGHYHERVDRFLTNYSVDWVAYPAAGGAISEFIRESEDEDDVEWEQLTPEMLKEHAPAVYEQIVAEGREPMAGTDDDKGNTELPTSLSAEDVKRLTIEAITEHETAKTERQKTLDVVEGQVIEAVEKSGLPELTRKRIVKSFAGAEAYDEAAVAEAINESKAELKAAGALGPQVRGFGPSTGIESVAPVPDAQRFPVLDAVERELGFHVATEDLTKQKGDA